MRPAALTAALARIDALLLGALARVASERGPEPDAFRGLYLREDDIVRELARPPLESRLCDAVEAGLALPELAPLGLDGFDCDVVLLALAPEVDLRYSRAYAYLQDDVTRRRPSVALALDLLCGMPGDRLVRRRRFDDDGILRRRRVISLVPQGDAPEPSLAHGLVPADEIVSLLLGVRRTAPGIRPVATHAGDGGRYAELLHEHDVLHLAGAEDDCRTIAAEVAHALDRPLLAAHAADGGEELVALLDRDALLAGAVALVEGVEAADERRLRRALEETDAPVIVAGETFALRRGSEPATDVGAPDREERKRLWREAGLGLADPALDEVADRYRLGRAGIAAAAAYAKAAARARSSAARPRREEVAAAARTYAAPRLGSLARRIAPAFGWADLVAPEDTIRQLRELCARVRDRRCVVDEWGFGRKLARVQGVTALFAGPSGTGKTMAAEIVAAELELELYRVDLSGVVSKYVGETEKNLDRVFAAAETGSAVLLFDEADALFGKRSEVRDSHDRYANLEVAYLLQRMESYDGLAVLTSNLAGNVEDSFARRLAFAIHFPFPEVDDRRRIWDSVWPAEAPLGDDVDLDVLARELRLAGGGIRNAAVAAAFAGAADGGVVRMEHVLHGARREFQKLGREGDLRMIGGAA